MAKVKFPRTSQTVFRRGWYEVTRYRGESGFYLRDPQGTILAVYDNIDRARDAASRYDLDDRRQRNVALFGDLGLD